MNSTHTARDIADTNSICRWNTDMYGVDPSKEGAQEYYDSLFALYASWGVDFVKVDDICNHYPVAEIEMINRALKNSGREMVLSLSPGPAPLEQAEHLKQNANMWRITDDFWDKWELLYAMFERAEKWCTHSGPGHWADADMLPLGAILQDYGKENRTKFTAEEQRTMLNLWCIMRSPLMIGGELCSNDDFTLGLLTNRQLSCILANSRSAHQIYRRTENGSERIVWTAYCKAGGNYLAVFNTADETADIFVSLAECELEVNFYALNLWTETKVKLSDGLSVKLPAHGSDIYLLTAE